MRQRIRQARVAAQDAATEAAESLREAAEEIKPKLRGLLHGAMAPLALAAGIVLIALSPNTTTRIGSSIFAFTALLLFTVSAIYNAGNWSPKIYALLRRLDHSNIYLLIAGSYTPFTLTLLHGRDRITLLAIVWTGALLGVLFRIFWTGAPRWLYTPIYILLGWAAIFYAPEFASGGASAVITLIAVGGILYTVGGVVYGLKRPNPFPRWFGFHEVFHSFTIAAFVCHYVAASIATYSVR